MQCAQQARETSHASYRRLPGPPGPRQCMDSGPLALAPVQLRNGTGSGSLRGSAHATSNWNDSDVGGC
jgi:hypothetical protein